MSDEEQRVESKQIQQIMKQNQNFKIREFEWFEVETKIRLFVQKLLEPTLKQIYEDRVIVDQVTSQIKLHSKEVKMLSDVVLQQGAGVPIFNEIESKFLNIDLRMNKIMSEKVEENSIFKRQQQRLDEELQKYQLIIYQIEASKQKLETDFDNLKKTNQDFRSTVEQVIQNLSTELTTNFSTNRQQINKVEQAIQSTDIKLMDIKALVKSSESKLTMLEQHLIESTRLQGSNINKFDGLESRLLKIENQNTSSKKSDNQIQQIQFQLNSIQQFLVLYSPLYTQSQISETLFSCLPMNQVLKLAAFERSRLEQYDRKILESNDNVSLSVMMDQYANIMEQISKRNQKLMALKAKEMESSNSDSQSNSSSSDQDNASVITSKQKNSQQQSPKKRNTNVLDYQFHEQQVLGIKVNFEAQISQIEDRLNSLTQDFKMRSKEMDEQNFLNQVTNQTSYQRQIDSFNSRMQQMDEQLRILAKDKQNSQNESPINNELRNTISTIISYLVLMTHLIVQDELDRQAIQLMGTKDISIDGGLVYQSQNKKQNKPVQLIGDCLSCSGQPIQLLQQFKLACLAYSPSDVVVEGKQFKRDQLLEMCTKLLWQAKKEYNDGISVMPQVASKLRSSSIPLSPGRINNRSLRLNKAKRLPPMTNFHDL